MRISKIETRVVTNSFAKPPRNPRSTWNKKQAFLVFVFADNGLLGVGEAWCEAMSSTTLACFLQEELAPQFVGADVEDFQRIWHRAVERTLVSAKPGITLCLLGAIETALWDLLAKSLGRPLYRLLGACTDRIPVYASGGLYADDKMIEDLAREMADFVAQGYRSVKMKVAGASLSEDVKRVAAVRDAIGPDTRLMVDAVYMLDTGSAVRMARAFAPFNVWFLEAPLAPGNLPGLRDLCSRSPVPIAGNEVAFGLDGYRDLIEAGIDVVHLDVNQCGGIAEGRRIAAVAGAFHRPVSFHCATSAVAFAANLHVAASVSNTESIEDHKVHRMLFDRLPHDSFVIEDGLMLLADVPGIGIDIDPETLSSA